MKKTIAIVLTLTLLLTGCGSRQKAPAETGASTEAATEATAPSAAPETTAPVAPTEAPKTHETQVMGDNIPVILLWLQQGGTVEVTGRTGSYAKVTANGREGLVEARLLRFPDEPFEGFTGYARWNTEVYGDFTCLGEPLEKLTTNTQVTVLEDLEDCYYVNLGEKTGYIPRAQLGKTPYVAQPDSGSEAPSSGGSGPQDGGDITLRHPGRLNLLADTVKTGTATVKTDGVPLIARLCPLGETVRVLEEASAPEGYTPVLEQGETAYISSAWLEEAGDFTAWEGYAGADCRLYENCTLFGEAAKTAYVNTRLTVLWEAGAVSLVRLDNAYYYAPTAALRQTPITATPAPEDTTPAAPGGSSGGSGGGELWTPPVL